MVRKVVPIALMLAWIACFGLSGPGGGDARAAAAEEFDTSGERIGELRLGMPEKELAAKVPCKPRKGKEIYEGATGETVQDWKYPDCGIELKMGSERKGAAKEVRSIAVKSPAKLATGRGILIGSTEEQVIRAYGQYRDQDGFTKKGKKFVAGSVFDGLIFDLKDGKVIGMFLGAAAE